MKADLSPNTKTFLLNTKNKKTDKS